MRELVKCYKCKHEQTEPVHPLNKGGKYAWECDKCGEINEDGKAFLLTKYGDKTGKNRTWYTGPLERHIKRKIKNRGSQKRMSLAKIGKVNTIEHNLKISKSMKNKIKSPEHREALSKALTGKKKSKEHIMKIKETKKRIANG